MFENQVVWISGASSGIGEALALEFAAAKAKLVLSARREDELQRVKALCEARGLTAGDVLVLPLDVTDYEAMPAALKSVLGNFGRIDLLVNNAGISHHSLCVDTEMSVYRRLFEVDVMGQIALTKTVLPTMLQQGSGHIAITASVAGKVGAPYRTGYCAAKHAVMGFYDSLRTEVVHYGLQVTTITPGYIRTGISKHALEGDGSEYGKTSKEIAGGMDANRCAEAILAGLRKGEPEIAVGDGPEMQALWLKRFFPKLLFKRAAQLGRPREKTAS